MPTETYQERRGELQTYFDRTAVEAWKKLTSDAPVSGIRATVRAGRDRMRATLLSWLPEDLHGFHLLDAGCGTGVLAMEAAGRGARVVAIDISQNLVNHASAKLPNTPARGMVDFRVGDMLDPDLGETDYVVAMDSLIHYNAEDIVEALAKITERTRIAVLFTVAPATTPLKLMHKVGKLFPRSDRAPAIIPVGEARIRRIVREHPALKDWAITRSERIKSGFYISQAFCLERQKGAL